jgi:hypothetical protein
VGRQRENGTRRRNGQTQYRPFIFVALIPQMIVARNFFAETVRVGTLPAGHPQ